MRIALAQINTTVGDFEQNVAKIIDAISRSREVNADIVTFPELAICGYPPEDLLLRQSFLRDSRDALAEIIRHSEGIVVVIGFPDVMNDKVYNAAAVIDNTNMIGVYHKAELPNYGVFDEDRYFSEGSKGLAFAIDGIPIALNICEDIWIEGSAAEQCAAGDEIKVALNISASPFHAGKLAQRQIGRAHV